MNAQKRLENAAVRLKEFFGNEPKNVTIYVVTESTSRSNLSGVYRAYIMKDNEPRLLIGDYRVSGCGLDRTFELAYNIFCVAYGYTNPKLRYQDVLRKENL